jgi:hypothetical protein
MQDGDLHGRLRSAQRSARLHVDAAELQRGLLDQVLLHKVSEILLRCYRCESSAAP